ncbi:hypothetical protein CPB83DRAFT_892433 [Crepidotus variabilis]|uniref:TPR-like protein n=1 Tax=Crepidotus variabilis TaxID=179855 RepID=A0A9P6EJE0_9AGAR|nr:hypothetical protein CPB83DRAFT_892433 [Crepidotus variabilis]
MADSSSNSATWPIDGILFDITMECSSEDASNPILEGMDLSVVDAREESPNAESLDRISSTVWKYQGIIELCHGIGQLVVIIGSEEAGDFGFLDLTEEIPDYLGVGHIVGTQAEVPRHKVVTDQGKPPLWVTFAASAIEQEQVRQEISALLSEIDKLAKPPSHDEGESASIDCFEAGTALLQACQETGSLTDISNAIENLELGVSLIPEDHQMMHKYLLNLGASHSMRFRQTGNLADLSIAIEHLQKSAVLTPEGHPDRPGQLSNLGNSLLLRFKQTGHVADLSIAIEHYQKSLVLTPEGHPDVPRQLNNLGNSFLMRFERTGDSADLSTAIEHLQKSVVFTPEGHPDMSGLLNNLRSSFLMRFERTGDVPDLSTAIEHLQKSVVPTPEGHPNMPKQLSNLGNSFLMRFKQTGDSADISIAIEHLQKSAVLTPEGHPDRPGQLSNLGNSFLMRFKQTDDSADLSIAIEHYQKSVVLAPEGHSDMSLRWWRLGNTLLTRFQKTSNIEDCQAAALNLCLAAAQNAGSPTVRLRASQAWAACCLLMKDYVACLRAFTTAFELLPLVASLDQTIHNRHTSLLRIIHVTPTAVGVALVKKRNDLALEWFEQGRCITWTQLNQLRTPVDLLQQRDAQLAEQFLAVSQALEISGSRPQPSWTANTTITQQIQVEGQVRSQLKLAQEFEQLLTQIRDFPNFNNFLCPPKAAAILSQLPMDGPLVLLNINEVRCDALALIHGADEPIRISLNNFTHEKAELLRSQLGYYLSCDKVRRHDSNNRAGRIARRPDTGLPHILRELWNGVVWPILKGLGYSRPPAHRNRIWWCLTGPLSFLPIHAAGIYDPDAKAPGLCLSDFAVSSYIPTVTTLLENPRTTPT